MNDTPKRPEEDDAFYPPEDALSGEADFYAQTDPMADDVPYSDAPPLIDAFLPAEQDGFYPELPENDPLNDAQSLPTLFPEDPLAPQNDADNVPTHVERPERRKKTTSRRVLRVLLLLGKWLLGVVIALAILAAGGIIYLTATEYHPAYAETAKLGSVGVTRKAEQSSYRILSFNTGYGGLDESADFFMDGGRGVNPESQKQVERNMDGIRSILEDANADFLFLQEVDTDSARSFGINQWLQYEKWLGNYESRFALNYSCSYVPYPISLTERIGRVQSGVATYSRFDIRSATRYSLPCPFSWPTRVANLKRCMLVTRIALDGKEQELVLVNVHLEAYDDGEGRQEQFEQVMALLEEEYAKGNYVICGGDFNQLLPGTDSIFPIKSTTGWIPGELGKLPDDWQYAYDENVPTCRLLNQPYSRTSSETQYYVIDGFIVSPNITVNSAATLDNGFVFSDHNPVLLEITLE